MKLGQFTAIIPVREGSKRLPNKNITPFGDTTLLQWKIRQLKACKEIDQIVVSSDSEKMLQLALEEGVGIHKRGIEYADDVTKSFGEVVAHVCENVSGEHIIWAPCTAPLVMANDFSLAISDYEQSLENGYDSLFSVEPFKKHIWKEDGPLNFKLGKAHVISQDLEQYYFVSYGFLIAPRLKMIEWNYLYGPNPKKHILDKIKCIDIDDQLDLEIAKAWLKLLV